MTSGSGTSWSSPNAKTLNATAWGGRGNFHLGGSAVNWHDDQSSRPRSIPRRRRWRPATTTSSSSSGRGLLPPRRRPGSTLPPKTLSFDAPWVDTEAKALEFAQKQATKLAGGEVPDSTLIDLGDTPTWVQTGDRVNTFGRYGTLADQRVVSRKVTRFNNGHAKLVPTLGSPSRC